MSLGRKDLGSPGDNSCAFPCSHCPRWALTRPHAETVARTSRVPVSDSPATHLTTHQPCVIPTKPPAPGKKMSTPLRENLKAGPPQGRPHPRDGDHFSQKPHLCAQIGAATGEARASHGGQKWLRVTSEARPPGMTLLCPAPWDTQAVSPAKDLATSGHLCQPFGDTAPTIPASWRSQQAQTPDVGVTGL